MGAVAALFLGAVLPGLAGAVLLGRRGRATAKHLAADATAPDAFLARALSCGLAIWLISTEACARTVGLSSAACWSVSAAFAGASILVLAVLSDRQVVRVGARGLAFGVALAAVGLAVWLPMGLVDAHTTWTPLQSTPWYYWGLAKQIALLGHVPATSPEWGTHVPFLRDYQAFSTATAALIDQTPSASMIALRALELVSVLTGACSVGLLARSLGASRLASLVAVPLLIGLDIFVIKYASYRPEAFAYGLAFLVAVHALRWFTSRDRGALIAGALTVAALAEVHGVILLVAAVLVLALAGAFVPSLRASELKDYVFSVVALGFAWGATTLLLALAMGNALATKDVSGISHAAKGSDPTWAFNLAINGMPPRHPPGNWFLVRTSFRVAFLGFSPWVVVGLVASVVIALVALSLLPRTRAGIPARRILAFALLFLGGTGLVVTIFALKWSTYVPRRTGTHRIVQLVVMVVPPIAACAISALAGLRLKPMQGIAALASAAIVVLSVLSTAKGAQIYRTERPSQGDVAALSSAHLGRNSLVLANGYSEGYIPLVLHADGLLDGRAPYTFPHLLSRANSLLRNSAAFFADPPGHSNFLVSNHVDYVLFVRKHTWALGSSGVFGGSRLSLERLPNLHPVMVRKDFVLYRVA